jgi:CRP-like cAMP-binding protein
MDYDINNLLCEENEIGEAFYVIISGEITLTKAAHDGSSIKVCILGRGSLFGEEIAVNYAETYEYSAIVTTIFASVMVIKKQDFF